MAKVQRNALLRASPHRLRRAATPSRLRRLGLAVTIAGARAALMGRYKMSGIFYSRTLSRAARSLRVRRLCADPLALMPLSLSVGRRLCIRFDWRRSTVGATAWSSFCLPPHRPPASHRARVPCLGLPLRGDGLATMRD
jgi:hypothetical protein